MNEAKRPVHLLFSTKNGSHPPAHARSDHNPASSTDIRMIISSHACHMPEAPLF